ncbi:putative glutathione S-transferase [Sesbania bispinosa]|nr:putative glutathione S-transferase [Sesbania bispinosa]
MDPNQFNMHAFWNFMQNSQPPINPDSQFSTQFQVPPFSSQVGLENITVDEEQEDATATAKKKRVGFSDKEDKLLIQSWLNISKDAIVGADQKANGFWLRISNSYNEHRGELQERKEVQLKARWQKLNGVVQKFPGCYKLASSVKQSGASENDVMAAAYEIYMKDEGKSFKLEYAWRLLKDEPKWTTEVSQCS